MPPRTSLHGRVGPSDGVQFSSEAGMDGFGHWRGNNTGRGCSTGVCYAVCYRGGGDRLIHPCLARQEHQRTRAIDGSIVAGRAAHAGARGVVVAVGADGAAGQPGHGR